MTANKRNSVTFPNASCQPIAAIVIAVTIAGTMLALANTVYAQTTCHMEWATMRDGTQLATEVYLPTNASGPLPVILQRTPYNRGQSVVGSTCNNATMQYFAQNGYAALNQDVRGRYRSQGDFHAMVQEANDGYDAIEWAAVQPWSNGKVGTFGGSYVGLTQWQPAIHTPPHLAAIAPRVTASDYHDHWTYVDAAFDLWFAQSWILGNLAPDTYMRQLEAAGLPPDQVQNQVTAWVTNGTSQILTNWVWQLPLTSFPEYHSKAPYYYDWLAHPSYDGFWAKLDVEPRYSNVTVPALNTGGWYDIFNIGTVRNFRGMRASGGTAEARDGTKLVLWSTCHACPANTTAGAIDFGPNNMVDVNALHLRFYDRWLKGIDNGIDREPPVSLFVMVPPDTGTTGSGFWISAEKFPLPGTQFTTLNLRSHGHANTAAGDGRLDMERPSQGPDDNFVYDPRTPVPTRGGNMCCNNALLPSGAFDQSTIEARGDVLVYTSTPLAQDVTVIGPVTLKFWAKSSAPDTDFTAKLVDVHPDGFAQNLLDRVVRARYRRGSKLPPSLIQPEKPYRYTILLGNTSSVFKKGHQIRLEISSSDFPHYARNLNTGLSNEDTDMIRVARQTIMHNPGHPSYLVLPIVPDVSVPQP